MLTGIRDEVISDYYSKFRERTSELNDKEFAVWKGWDVQIDESLFGRHKYHRGRAIEDQWVFGMCDANPNGGRIHDLCRRSYASDFGAVIILDHTEPEAVISSDMWGAYANLNQCNRQHLQVNHSHEFVNAATHAHSQRIEALWSQAKKWLKVHSYISRMYIDSYLKEFTYRYNHSSHMRDGNDFGILWTTLYRYM
jgi:transposase-like protein